MVNEAVRDFIAVRSAEVESKLARMLTQIQDYRRSDPGFELALGKLVAAEAGLGADDPAEGRVVLAAESADAGPAQSMVRRLLKR